MTSYFPNFFYQKIKRTGRSHGRITVRNRGSGFFARAPIIRKSNFFFDFGLFSFYQPFNFSGKFFPSLIFCNSFQMYSFFLINSVGISRIPASLLKRTFIQFSASNLSVFKAHENSLVLAEESKKLEKNFYFSRFIDVSTGCFMRALDSQVFKKYAYACAENSYARLLKRKGSQVYVKLPSGVLKRFRSDSSFFVLGYKKPEVFLNPPISKAGTNRNFGIRPSVRGVAINPVDHPHGGRTGESRPSVSPWGILTKNYPTVRRLTKILA